MYIIETESHNRDHVGDAQRILNWCADHDVEIDLFSGFDLGDGQGYKHRWILPDEHLVVFALGWSTEVISHE